ncbi:RAS, dexamethasone-induced Ras-related protein 1 [Mytilus galloprovincialis]|uniref:RAS, dexamethasone-induced Ras-related protein 1 n=1 Tax=Mytilus galloprovincialis TaxID=29158 RepID=A0A8B6G343_MYTGA|nr:RAS, dexamethasone-induced Ras-related protein 1 [Mytilus galloprovincialis]
MKVSVKVEITVVEQKDGCTNCEIHYFCRKSSSRRQTQLPLLTKPVSSLVCDIFLLMFDICDRESFNEVTRLCQQIYEIKGQCRTRIAPKICIPMVIIGNKCDREKHREIDSSEGEELARQYTNVSFTETSAKKNVNVEDAFIRLFTLAKMPAEMSPSLHRKVHPGVIDDETTSRKSLSIRRRLSEACGTIAPNARRPSIRTDLLTAQMRGSTSRSLIATNTGNSKCTIQ